jgi:hypothetical protein
MKPNRSFLRNGSRGSLCCQHSFARVRDFIRPPTLFPEAAAAADVDLVPLTIRPSNDIEASRVSAGKPAPQHAADVGPLALALRDGRFGLLSVLSRDLAQDHLDAGQATVARAAGRLADAADAADSPAALERLVLLAQTCDRRAA